MVQLAAEGRRDRTHEILGVVAQQERCLAKRGEWREHERAELARPRVRAAVDADHLDETVRRLEMEVSV